MRRLRGARVAITGASSGIGAAGALAFAREGCRLALAARDEAALAHVAERARAAGAAEVRTRRVDVALPQDLQAWAEELQATWGALDVAVANAGVGHFGPFLEAEPEHLERLVQTNLLGVWRTAQAMGPLLEAAHGHLLVVGSVAGKIPLPYLAAYCGTKAALLAWSRSVRPELRRRGIALTHLGPGATRTPFAARSLRRPGLERSDLDERIGRGMAPEGVGRAMVRAARWRPKEMDLTLDGRAGVLAAWVAPHLLARGLEWRMRPKGL